MKIPQAVIQRGAVFLVLLLSPKQASAQAQSDVFDQFFRYTETEHKEFYDGMPDETIDPFSGTLHIVQTDVVLPGKAGLDLRIVRSYSSKIWGRTDDPSLDSLLAEFDSSVLGYGWSFHMGRIKNPNASGQPTGPCSADYPILEMPDGSARVFYRVSASNPNVYISRDYWRMETNCSVLGGGGTGSCVWSTNGIRYEFSSSYGNSYVVGRHAPILVWPASAIVDPHGNRISISYVQDHNGAISSITDTYNRQITFTYVKGGDGARLDTMTVGSNTYQYKYTPYPTLGGGSLVPRRFLTEVIPPAGPSFKYAYAITNSVSQNQYALNSVIYPHGGTVAYSYASADFFASVGPLVPFAVVQSKTVTDRGGASLGKWTYMFSAPSSGMNTTSIVRPDGRGGTTTDVYTMFGFGSVANGSIWKVGLTQEISRGDGAEVETLTWDGRTSNPVAHSIYPAPAYVICAGSTSPPVDNVVYAPALARRDIVRDGTKYSTVYSNFDTYGQPQNVSESGQLSRNTTWTYFSQPTDANGQTLNLVRGMPLTQQVWVGGDSFSNSWTYSGPGYAKDTETLSGVTTRFGYGNDGNLSLVTNAENRTVSLSEYEIGGGTPCHLDFGAGTIIIKRTTTWEGRIQTQTDGRNNTTQYDYDRIGRVKKITPPGSNDATTYVYDDANGATATAMRGSTYSRTKTIDGFGREIQTLDSLGVTTSVKYDELGRVWFQSAPYDTATDEVGEKLDRDVLGRVLTITKGCRGGNTAASACSGNYLSTVTNVYGTGNCVTTVVQRIPDTLTTTRCYSSFGNPDECLLTSVTDAAGKSWLYTYTATGNLRTVWAPIMAGNRTYEYDSRQYLIGVKTGELGLISGDTVSLRYLRNAIGQMTSRTDARGVTWTYDYNDGLNRLTRITYGPGCPDDVTLSYQPSTNNVAQISSAKGGTFNFNVYDELNRLRNQQWIFDGITYETTFDYDTAGCLFRIKYPTGSIVTQTCDAANRVTGIQLDGAQIVSKVSYRPSGQPNAMTFGNGVSTNITYDDRARMETLTSAGIIDLAYRYDGTDNVISLDNRAVPGSSRTMGYDKLNRLANVQGSNLWGSAIYEYDELGNRTLKSIGNQTTTYTYDPQTNRLATASGSDSFVPMTLNWDLPGRLASSSDGVTYRYDGRGRRVQKADTNLTKLFHYGTSGQLISETLPNGQKLRDYIYLGNKLLVVDGCMTDASSPCSERQWYHTDALGSVLARTDSQGTLVSRFDYLPWGEDWKSTAGAGSLQYNGRFLDSGTGLYDYGARLYWPAVGRFISPDAASPDPVDPMSFNLYAYVLCNPYKYVDPSGHVATDLTVLTEHPFELVDSSENTRQAVDWLAGNYPGLFPVSEKVRITEGDPGEEDFGVTDPLTGDITIQRGMSLDQTVDTVAHELLHSRLSASGRLAENVRIRLDKWGVTHSGEHEFIHMFGRAVQAHFRLSQKDPSFDPRTLENTVFGRPVIVSGGDATLVFSSDAAQNLDMFNGMGIGRVDVRYSWRKMDLR